MLKEINTLIKDNLKLGKKDKVNALRLVKSELLNNEKKAIPRTELEVVKSYAKTLKKSMDAYSGHPERLSAIELELEVVKTLLPKEPSREDLQAFIDICIPTGAATPKPHAGKLVGTVKNKFPNADGSLVMELVNASLNR